MSANNTRINSMIPILTALAGIGALWTQPAQAQCVSPPANTVSWWRAEGDAADFVGSNHGTLMNGVTFAPGKVGQAFDLHVTRQGCCIGACRWRRSRIRRLDEGAHS